MAELLKDLICGMEIDPDTAAGKSDYQGTTYYFCAEGCKKEFDANPDKYVGGGAEALAAEAAPAAAPAAEAPAAAPAAEAPAKRWWEFWK